MADSNQNFVTNNVTVESGEVIKFVNPFNNRQQHQIEDFSLFLNASKKCRCCFSKLINECDQHTVESWHRQAFLALTGVEMNMPDSENFLCLKCAEILKIYSELGKSAANLQRKYNILMQDLASDIKTEIDETDEITGRLQNDNVIVISDDESVSDENEQTVQPQQTNSSDTTQNETNNDDEIRMEENSQSIENSARGNKCSVRLTRIDSETIDKYEHYSIFEITEEQTISKISTTSAKSKRSRRKFSTNNLKCHICGKTSKNRICLKKHITNIHNRSRLLSCDLCGKSLTTKYGIRKHMHACHHMSHKFSCNLCSVEFQSYAILCDHKKTIHRKNFKCEDCEAVFEKPSLFSEHIKLMHSGTRWCCLYQECSSSFPIRSYAITHLQKYHSLQGEEIINKYLKLEKNYQSKTKCQTCGLIATNKTALYEHVKETHINTMRFSCDLCGTTFSHKQKTYLIDHMINTHQLKVKFSCTLCPAEFQSNLELSFHESKAHNKKLKCEKCDATFKEPCRLKKHVKKKHEGKLYHCAVPGCSRSFSLIDSARHHLFKWHALKGEEYRKYSAKFSEIYSGAKKEVDLKCRICGKASNSKKSLLAHMTFVHTKNKCCDFCGEIFPDKMHLIDHIQTYHMNLKFSCNICSLELRSDRKLRKHKQRAHNKNFKCHECNSAFGHSFVLKEHVKVKHEGKRYHCNYPGCSKSFLKKNLASKHLKVAHSLFAENFNKFHEKLTLQ